MSEMAILKRLHSMIIGKRYTKFINASIGEDIFIGARVPQLDINNSTAEQRLQREQLDLENRRARLEQALIEQNILRGVQPDTLHEMVRLGIPVVQLAHEPFNPLIESEESNEFVNAPRSLSLDDLERELTEPENPFMVTWGEPIDPPHLIPDTYGVREIINIAGGINEDNNITTLGDVLITFTRAVVELRERMYNGRIQIISNERLKIEAENHFYTTANINEYDRILRDEDVVEWRIDYTLPNGLFFKNIPSNLNDPRALVRTGLLTLDAPQSTSEMVNDILNGEAHYINALRSKGLIPDNRAMGYRKCWMCERRMNFRECVEANKTMKLDELMKSWKHENVEIACCSCTDRLKRITTDKIKEIIIFKSSQQRYIVQEDCLDIMNESGKVRLIFTNNVNYIDLSEQQFRALLDKHIIDVPIELEGCKP